MRTPYSSITWHCMSWVASLAEATASRHAWRKKENEEALTIVGVDVVVGVGVVSNSNSSSSIALSTIEKG